MKHYTDSLHTIYYYYEYEVFLGFAEILTTVTMDISSDYVEKSKGVEDSHTKGINALREVEFGLW